MSESPFRPLFAAPRRVRVGRSFVMPGKKQFDHKQGRHTKGARPVADIAESPAARKARIERLRQQIENGTYRPDLEKVAERLLPELLDER